MKQDAANRTEVGFHESDIEPSPFTEKTVRFCNITKVLVDYN